MVNRVLPVACFLLIVHAVPGRQIPIAAQNLSAPASDFIGAWSGEVTHDGENVPLAVEIEVAGEGMLELKVSLPALHVSHASFGKSKAEPQGDEIRIGPFRFTLDRRAGTLSGTMPEALVPVYRLPFVLRRVPKIEDVTRVRPDVPPGRPVWIYNAGSALWPGPTFAGASLYVGGDDGVVHALEAQTGRRRWTFRSGGAVRSRPTIDGRVLYVSADDGFVYALDAASGAERWRVRVTDAPVERLPFDNPKSRFDRFGADVTAANGRLFVGTHDGRLVALDPDRGRVLWEYATGDSILAAPAIASGRLYVGSFDRHVYALDAATGRLLWKRDTQGAVVSTPALAGSTLVVGNRIYDLLGLDADSGEVAWKRYVWFSWVESSATIRDGIAYVGSSDAAAVFAVEAVSGRQVWKADAYGWAWGQPAVTGDRVYIGTSSTPGYLGGAHVGGAMAFDRATGRAVWRSPAERGQTGAPYGFPGSPAVGDGLVFFAGLDGRVRAFER